MLVAAIDSMSASDDVTPKDFNESSLGREAIAQKRVNTGLHVVAVEDKNDVIKPAHELGQRLGWLSLAALMLLLMVALGMWFLVNQMLKESRERMARAFTGSGTTGADSFMDLPTLAQTHDANKTEARS
jgi:hypothetical protein